MLLRPDGFRKLCEVRDRLRDVSDDAPTVEAIAAAVGLSPAHLTRRFQALFGCTPHQYRIAQRLAQARALLASGDRSVTDVCMAVGFSSLGSFSTLFAARVGEPPSAYRRRMRPGEAPRGASPKPVQPGCLTLLGQLPDERFREASPARR